MTRTEWPKDDPEQSKRFIDAAREAEADETEVGADRVLERAVLGNGVNIKKRSRNWVALRIIGRTQQRARDRVEIDCHYGDNAP